MLGDVVTLADDATPSIAAGTLFNTGGTTTITDFDDGAVGRTITILAAHTVTITDNAAIFLDGAQNFDMVAGDTLTLKMVTDQVWHETSRLERAGRALGGASSTDNAVARFNGTTGKIIQNSGVIVDDSDNVTGVVALTTTGKVAVGTECEVDGDFNHDGSNVGFFGVAPADRPGATEDIKDGLTTLGLLQGTSATPLDLDAGALTCGAGTFSSSVEIDGDLNHDGSNVGFYGTAPASQPAAYTQTYSTADKTHANPTAATLTDSTGGSADQTLSLVDSSGNDRTTNTVINDNFAECADEVNKLVADLADVKQLLNSVIDDLQTLGLLQ